MRKFCYLIISFRNIITVLICVVLCLCAVIGYDVINNYKAASLSLTKKPTVIIDAGKPIKTEVGYMPKAQIEAMLK